MTAVFTCPSQVNLLDLSVFEEERAHDILRMLRAEDPVHWNEGDERNNGFWSITKYADILHVSRHPELFISSKGIAGPGLRPEFIERLLGSDAAVVAQAQGTGNVSII